MPTVLQQIKCSYCLNRFLLAFVSFRKVPDCTEMLSAKIFFLLRLAYSEPIMSSLMLMNTHELKQKKKKKKKFCNWLCTTTCSYLVAPRSTIISSQATVGCSRRETQHHQGKERCYGNRLSWVSCCHGATIQAMPTSQVTGGQSRKGGQWNVLQQQNWTTYKWTGAKSIMSHWESRILNASRIIKSSSISCFQQS